MVKFLFAKEKTRVRFPLSAVAYVLNTIVIVYIYIFLFILKSNLILEYIIVAIFIQNVAETGFEPVTSRL